ncbi:hypothetical protein MIND_00421500 [Mycena indigotica]|uniref:Uncharacterized protein n=1 Tax=Mycena indigotica TaxID=2126181 RepID=A0A8H6SVT9_9AGAR|nr:uncharacterized protein MIND_00421500 [Mycena indigotica]KAF7306304.1 hypothetical protein MIND_00421500 [Mycena indigotica]
MFNGTHSTPSFAPGICPVSSVSTSSCSKNTITVLQPSTALIMVWQAATLAIPRIFAASSWTRSRRCSSIRWSKWDLGWECLDLASVLKLIEAPFFPFIPVPAQVSNTDRADILAATFKVRFNFLCRPASNVSDSMVYAHSLTRLPPSTCFSSRHKPSPFKDFSCGGLHRWVGAWFVGRLEGRGGPG